MSGPTSRYVLLTAAYNEESHIARTLESVAAQSWLPQRWVIVSDGSSDGTEEIVRSYAARLPWIELVVRSRKGGHSFKGKVGALHVGEERLRGIPLDYFGILDADVSFDPGYFAALRHHFEANSRLGVGGGIIVQEVQGRREIRIKYLGSVAGAVQFFREPCYAATGGFPFLEHGGEDAAVEIAARMKGWEVQTFPNLEVIHYGRVGSAAGSRLRTRFKWGQMNQQLGYHLLFELARCARRVVEPPFLFGSVGEFAGYLWSSLAKGRPAVSPDLVDFLRREQLDRLFGRRDRGVGNA